jgi:hypothetical protein
MAAKLITPIFLFWVSTNLNAQAIPKLFMGRKITITEPKTDADGFFPLGPASVCLEGPPQRQCYTAPEDFGRVPSVTVVQMTKNMPGLFFSAASGGVSGWRVHFALLRPGMSKDLEDVLLTDTEVSNQSQHAFWNDPSISSALIFVTANYVWGPDEGHYGDHRYIISAYVLKREEIVDDPSYYLEDRYMTARKYDLEAHANILASEKPEILARLRRLRQPH